MFLQYVDENAAPRPGTPEMEAEVGAYGKLFEELTAAGVLRGGDPCQPSAAAFSVQVKEGRPVTTAGPMHAAPGLNGYWVLDCKDRAEAIDWAAKIPAAQGGGTVEVHPIFEM